MATHQLKRLSRQQAVFLCCDIQSIFKATVHKFDHVATTASFLVEAAKVMGIPVVVSEQYPDKLGHTVPSIDLQQAHVYSKTLFSMVSPSFPNSLLTSRSSFVLFGIETHVCVQQTALDLLEIGKHVVLVTDGVSSSRPLDRSTAISRLSSAGAILMTAESVLFELMRSKDADEFRDISRIAKAIATYAKENETLCSL